MLGGILNRGFSSKCKSLIKGARTRIEVVRRRVEAKQRFLKEDLAKLLDNGLDINAYGRTEDFLLGQDQLSCYNFVEQSCEFIVKQLSYMQKLRDCPEDCRGAVASLMFAAARFSDLPELRELRDLFQERYGSALECFVNQKFMEKLSSKSPAVEKRIQLLQDIALEFSIRWNSTGFQRRMALAQAQPNQSGASHVSAGNHIALDCNYIAPKGKASGSKADEHVLGQRPKGFNDQQRVQDREGTVSKREKRDLHSSERNESSMDGNKPLVKQDATYSRGKKHDSLFDKEVEQARTRNKAVQENDDFLKKVAISGSSSQGERQLEGFDNKLTGQNGNHGQIHMGRVQDPRAHASYNGGKHDVLFDKEVEHARTRHKAVQENDDSLKKIARSGSSSHGERQLDNKLTGQNENHGQIPIRRAQDPLSYARPEAAPSRGLPIKSDGIPSASDRASERNVPRSVLQEDGDRLSTYANFALPPPYSKSKEKAIPPPYVKSNERKERAHRGSKQSASERDGHLRSTSPRDRLDTPRSSSRLNKDSDLPDDKTQANKPTRINNHNHEKESYYKDGLTLPKPRRSVRRKHHKSESNNGEEGKSEDARVAKKSSSSRRREHSRKGLQIFFDDDHHRKDDEERMIDKLLLHYSKKPSSDLETLKRNPKADLSHLTSPDTGECSNNRTNRQHETETDMAPFPKRSTSLPHEQTAAPSEAAKVFARANSFQPDNQACHVHPKLPDYDDLTARFAALRGR